MVGADQELSADKKDAG